MQTILRSVLRILAATAGILILTGIAFVLAVRQPIVGRYPFPAGPRADPAILRQHVEYLCTQTFPRNPTVPDRLNLAADYVKGVLSGTGADVTEQPYQAWRKPFRNIVARFGPSDGPRVVVGAHYDVYGELPGADDNASGVAGLLELARLLAARDLQSPVELVAFSTEEPPYFGGSEMGSAVHAASLQSAHVSIKAMIGLEMIGFFSPSQPYTTLPLYLAYPTTGDFITVAGRWDDRSLAREFKRCFRGATAVPAMSYSGPVGIGADLSDHRKYWAAGYSAIMVTDTAFMRNANYHTAQDVPSSLDFVRMAGVVDGVLSGVVHLAETDGR